MEMGLTFKRPDGDVEMDEAAREKVAQFVTSRVGGMRCTDHDKVPTVIVSGNRLDRLRFDVEGCCQKIIHLVKAKLEG